MGLKSFRFCSLASVCVLISVSFTSAMAFWLGCVLAVAQAAFFAAGQSGYEYVAQGEEAFENVQVNESISLFDKAIGDGYPVARLWQRGISLYYADRFEDGSKQFR